MTKHTKGEWYAKPTAGHDLHGQSVVYADGVGRGKDVAIVYDGDADAQLIAAAPDLLLALETIEAATDGLSNALAIEINRTARAAISKLERGE
jgi:hypothetical protein